ncbi:adenine phosphoribosyltransferase [Kineococcus sp. R8]|nr:adenine phosphoribosyltransferase [Kineococcus siccus]
MTGDRPDVAALVAATVRDVPDWPSPGIAFKDIAPLLADPAAFSAVVAELSRAARACGATAVAGIESRGFMLAAPVAERCGLPFLPVRKAGKMPPPVLHREYELEYGTAAIELRSDLVGRGDRVLVVDDVLATGGTAQAACALVAEAGAVVAQVAVLLELQALGGRALLEGHDVLALLAV